MASRKMDQYDHEYYLSNYCWAVQHGECYAGLFVDYYLSGPDGAHFIIFVPPGADREQVDKAKRAIRNDRDATGFTVRHVTPEFLVDAGRFNDSPGV